MRQIPADLFINLGLLLVGIFLLVLSFDYPDMASRFPQLVLIALVILIALDISNKIRAKIWKKTLEQGDGREIPGGNQNHRRAFYMVGLMCAFQVAMLVLGFTLGTLIFLILSIRALGYRKIKALTVSSLIITGFIYFIFILIMDSYFPRALILEWIGG